MKTRNIVVVVFILSNSCTGHADQELPGDKTGNIEVPRIQGLKDKANKLYQNDDYLDAVRCFDTLINEDPTNGDYYFKRAYSYGKLIKNKEAIADFKRSVKLHYKVNHSYLNIGIFYSFENDSAALYYFKKCLETDPGYPNAYKELRECENRLKIRQTSGLGKKSIF